jgi:hypothetical protein
VGGRVALRGQRGGLRGRPGIRLRHESHLDFRGRAVITAPRYLVAFGISYGANLAVLAGGLQLSLPVILAQAAALSTYSVVFFLLCRYFVFKVGVSGTGAG